MNQFTGNKKERHWQPGFCSQ